MHCFACLTQSAEFADTTKGAAFCNVACQQAFYIGGDFEVLLNNPTWNKDLFVRLIQETKTPWQPYHLVFIDQLLGDASEDQRETLFRWMLEDPLVMSVVFTANATREEIIVYLIQRSVDMKLKNILLYVPIPIENEILGINELKHAVQRPDANVDIIRILHLRFKYSVNRFINYGISYFNLNSLPERTVAFLKLFSTLLNDEGVRMVQPFIRMIEMGDKYLTYASIEYTRSVFRALELLLSNTNVSIEPETSTKKIKRK